MVILEIVAVEVVVLVFIGVAVVAVMMLVFVGMTVVAVVVLVLVGMAVVAVMVFVFVGMAVVTMMMLVLAFVRLVGRVVGPGRAGGQGQGGEQCHQETGRSVHGSVLSRQVTQRDGVRCYHMRTRGNIGWRVSEHEDR